MQSLLPQAGPLPCLRLPTPPTHSHFLGPVVTISILPLSLVPSSLVTPENTLLCKGLSNPIHHPIFRHPSEINGSHSSSAFLTLKSMPSSFSPTFPLQRTC